MHLHQSEALPSTLEIALDYAATGWPVFPCNPKDKTPMVATGFKAASSDEEQVRSWWASNPNAMIGVPTGEASDVFVLDIDVGSSPDRDGFESLRLLEEEHGPLPSTAIAETPSGGTHYFFKNPGGIKNAVNIRPGIDVRGNGGYVIAPGSVRIDGAAYAWDIPRDQLADAPAWLVSLIRDRKKADKTATAAKPRVNPKYTEGAIAHEISKLVATTANRNDALNKAAFAVGQFVGAGIYSRELAEARLFAAAEANGYVAKDGADAARATLKSGLDSGILEPRFNPTTKKPSVDFSATAVPLPPANDNFRLALVTEDAAAERFAELYEGKLHYCHSTGAWFEWDGTVWKKNDTKLAFHWARMLARELAAGQSPKDQKAIQKTSFASGVERFSQADPRFATTIAAWDKGSFKLGTPKGTVDLSTGFLAPANPADRITKLTAASPSSTAECPRWRQFLDECTGGDTALIRFLQQWCGYCLTADTREHALIFVFGSGGNGKSVFLNTVSGILGDYAVTAAMDTFTASKSDKHPTDLAMLRGARLVTASETEEGKPWAEARIKQMTGGDPISARFMRQDFFTFRPQFKLTIIGNHKPVLQNVDDAIRRRFNIIPFERKPLQPDRQLETKLKAEWPGILRWMIEGCRDWQANGLVRPESIVKATEAYFTDQDLLGQWLEEKCDVDQSDAKRWYPAGELFISWKDYAAEAGEPVTNVKAFGEALVRRGFLRERRNSGRGYLGLRLKH
jgi:putative DNA primase/helicase